MRSSSTTTSTLNSQQGFVLVTTLLFLCFMSLGALYLLESTNQELKLQLLGLEQQNLWQLAEQGLLKSEKNLTRICEPNLCTEVKKIDEKTFTEGANQIPVSFYEITATAKRNAMQVILQATYARLPSGLTEFSGIKAGQQSWRQLA